MRLGCIGDDFTGSSDLGLMLAQEGMRVMQYSGTPTQAAEPDVDAGVVALKTRTVAVEKAVEDSLEALDWLLAQGCTRILFKYCSTFDSTSAGNIGPVIDALMDRLDTDRTIVCPAFPATGRQVFQGHLFVGDRLLSECGMQHHPLTPMTDPDIRRCLSPQTRHAVGHVSYHTVMAGAESVRSALENEVAEGRRAIVIDALADQDLRVIGAACQDTVLVTGGSGIGMGIAAALNASTAGVSDAPNWQGSSGPAVVLSGSCSSATQAQVSHYAQTHPSLSVSPAALVSGDVSADAVLRWIRAHLNDCPLVYSTDAPEAVAANQATLGRDASAGLIEAFFGGLARELVREGVTRLVVAGGETSGAVIQALDVPALRIGPGICPGVPALSVPGRGLVLALKSGNFGDVAFFETALKVMGDRYDGRN